jgi:hypothetical protein
MDEVMEIVAKYEGDIKSIKKNVLQMCWHMRGGVTYEEIMNMSISERNLIGKIIEEHMETTKKSGLPYF